MALALELRSVTVRYPGAQAPTLTNLELALGEGERVALVGLNGSGKTSLLLAIVGLVPHEGQLKVAGELLSAATQAALRRKVGFLFNVPEDQLLFPTVSEDVAFGLVSAGLPHEQAEQRAAEVLASLGIGELAHKNVHLLSHGQKQRVALAGALVSKPPLLLLDEPTAGLDPPARLALAELLRKLDSAQLIATHDLDFVERLGARVLVLEQGRMRPEPDGVEALRQGWGLLVGSL